MTVPQRHANGRLLPGQASLNAGGRPRTDIAELRQKYRNRLPELLERLFDLTESDNPHVCIAATKELLDRLLGKPAVFVDTTHTKFDLGAAYLQALKRVNSINGSVGAASDPSNKSGLS
jgi:hypothetical protein